MLTLESKYPWDRLPPDYWDEYLTCAELTNMPAHAIRAGDRAAKLKAPASERRDLVMQIARNRFKTPAPGATYTSQEVWTGADKRLSEVAFTNYLCGIKFASPPDWQLKLMDVTDGVCIAQMKTGPYVGKTGDVIPNLLLLARRPKPGESISDFIAAAIRGRFGRPSGVVCPYPDCLSLEFVEPGVYKGEGDGHFIVVAFKRDAPEYPGLLLEEPWSLPSGGSDEQVKYFHPTERFHRQEGTLYYLVGIDTAESVLMKAKSDYETFLKGFQAE